MPIRCSKRMDERPSAYSHACARSSVVDMNAYSTPPLTPSSFSDHQLAGRQASFTPRHTVPARVSLLS